MGSELQPDTQDVYATPASNLEGATAELVYAGFWVRAAALFIDYLVLMIPMLVLSGGFLAVDDTGIAANLASVPLVWLYFALMESGERQATLGKRAVNLKVVDGNGERVSFGKATGRHFAKIISGLVLYLGFIWAGIDSRKQGWHDKMAGTFVVRA